MSNFEAEIGVRGDAPARTSAIAEVDQNDKRNYARRRVLKGGTIAFNDRHSTLPCFVRDLSVRGARLKVDGSVNAPDTFELLIDLDGLEAECEVVWRTRTGFGVKFTAPANQVTPRRKQVIVLNEKKPSLRRKRITK